MSNLNFSGKVTFIGETVTGTSAKGEWTKTSFKVEEEDGSQYPNAILFDAFNKQTIIDKLEVGQSVDVLYNSKVNENGGRMFNSLSVWKVDVVGGSSTNSEPTQASIRRETPTTTSSSNEPDDLPF